MKEVWVTPASHSVDGVALDRDGDCARNRMGMVGGMERPLVKIESSLSASFPSLQLTFTSVNILEKLQVEYICASRNPQFMHIIHLRRLCFHQYPDFTDL